MTATARAETLVRVLDAGSVGITVLMLGAAGRRAHAELALSGTALSFTVSF